MQCDDANAYCEINMTDFKRILRKGEEVTNPTDPCEMYHCIVSHTVLLVRHTTGSAIINVPSGHVYKYHKRTADMQTTDSVS